MGAGIHFEGGRLERDHASKQQKKKDGAGDRVDEAERRWGPKERFLFLKRCINHVEEGEKQNKDGSIVEQLFPG